MGPLLFKDGHQLPPLSISSLKVIPQEGSSQPTTWSHLATEARALARR